VPTCGADAVSTSVTMSCCSLRRALLCLPGVLCGRTSAALLVVVVGTSSYVFEWHVGATVLPCAITATLLRLGFLACSKPRGKDASETPDAEPRNPVPLPAEHPYYAAIDRTTIRFRSERAINLSEARRRARFRSHDPRRWRAHVFHDGQEDEDDMSLTSPDRAHFDWSVAEHAMSAMETLHGMKIQRPPLAYSDESARRLTKETSCEWYFSISAFDEALLNGIIEIKHVGGEQSVLVDLSKQLDPAKPIFVKQRSPSGVMELSP